MFRAEKMGCRFTLNFYSQIMARLFYKYWEWNRFYSREFCLWKVAELGWIVILGQGVALSDSTNISFTLCHYATQVPIFSCAFHGKFESSLSAKYPELETTCLYLNFFPWYVRTGPCTSFCLDFQKHMWALS